VNISFKNISNTFSLLKIQ